MTQRTYVWITARERALLRQALAMSIRSKHPDASEMLQLERKVRRASKPKVSVGIEGGMVQWVSGNPFPIRICDYDIDGVYPDFADEKMRPCVISFEPEDPLAKSNRYRVP